MSVRTLPDALRTVGREWPDRTALADATIRVATVAWIGWGAVSFGKTVDVYGTRPKVGAFGGTPLPKLAGIAVVALVAWYVISLAIYQAEVRAHEWCHHLAARRLGFNSWIEYEEASWGHRVPFTVAVGGACTYRPAIDVYEAANWRFRAVAIAPIAIIAVLLPVVWWLFYTFVPYYYQYAWGGVATLTVLLFGPSMNDYAAATRPLPQHEYDAASHRTTEGIHE